MILVETFLLGTQQIRAMKDTNEYHLIIGSKALPQESVTEKLRREADLLGGGLLDGLKSSCNDALANPLETVEKVGASAALGYGLTALQGRAGMVRLAAEVGGLALGYAFVKDVASRVSVTSEAFIDTWHSGENQDRNRQIVAGTFGSFAVDFALTSAGGMAGVGIAKNTSWLGRSEGLRQTAQQVIGAQKLELVPRYKAVQVEAGAQRVELPVLMPDHTLTKVRSIDLPVDSPIANAYSKVVSGIGRVEVLVPNGEGGIGGNFGTSFSLTKDGKMATAAHVVDKAVDITIFDSRNNAHSATVTGIDRDLDLAILDVNGAKFKPLIVQESMTAVGDQAFAMGFPNGWNQLYASPGQIEAVNATHLNRRMLFGMVSEEGNSGGPIVNQAGEVIAVLTSGARNSTRQTYATSINFLKPLLDKSSNGFTSTDAFVDRPFATTTIPVSNKFEGAKNLESMFGQALYGEMPLDLFHSRVKRVHLPGSKGSELALAAQFRPAENAIIVKPVAIDGLPIAQTAKWYLTGLPIKGSSLKVTLDHNNMPVLMELTNDPHTILQQAFLYRDSNGYLAGLVPVKH